MNDEIKVGAEIKGHGAVSGVPCVMRILKVFTGNKKILISTTFTRSDNTQYGYQAVISFAKWQALKVKEVK